MNLTWPNLLVPDRAYSVMELTTHIQDILEHDDHLQQIWVTGEVSSVSQYRSGLFFTLQDPADKAAISCVVWNNQINKLMTLPTQGEQLIVLGRIRIHAQRGQYQLLVWQLLPAGEGLRSLRYRQLRDRLQAEGIFDPERKRPIPAHPQVIAVVTSPQAAAWGDIQRTLRYRYPGLQVQFSPALVQGDQAPDSIVAAIHRVEQAGRAEVLLLSRGGGATEDMACFNDERVVRAVANCSIPVIAGIGHQRDESLTDLAADLYVHTPTAAAESAVPDLAALYASHQERVLWLQSSLAQYLQTTTDRLHWLRDRLSPRLLELRLEQYRQTQQRLQQRLIRAMRQRVLQASQHHHLLHHKLSSLDPHAVLQRGYALVRQMDGTIARSSAVLELGQPLQIQLSHGRVTVTVTEVLNEVLSNDDPVSERSFGRLDHNGQEINND